MPHLLVIKFKCSEVLPGLTELPLLHPLPDEPVDKGALGVHQVELVVQPRPRLHDRRRVGEAAHRAMDFRKIPSRNYGWWLVVDSHLDFKDIEECGACPTLNPVGHQSTKLIDFCVLIEAIEALTSFGTTSPLYKRQTAMYFPFVGSHLTIWLPGSKHAWVIVSTPIVSWYAISGETSGE